MSKTDKLQKKLQEDHKWYDKVTSDLTRDRQGDRGWESFSVLQRAKKIKLSIKDKLEEIRKKQQTTNNNKGKK